MAKLSKDGLMLAALAIAIAGCSHRAHPQRAAWLTPQVQRASVPAVWPPLPTSGYIRDRVATASDVASGNAVFAACSGVSGQTLRVTIPQYALWHDTATGRTKPVLVVEAELFDGDSMLGLREIPSGTAAMAPVDEVALLGQTPARVGGEPMLSHEPGVSRSTLPN